MSNLENIIKKKNSLINNINPFPEFKTQLALKKINLEEKPEYEKFLTTYFSDPTKYFLKDFKNSPIVVGKKYNPNSRFKLQYSGKLNVKKKYKKPLVLQSINETKNKSSLEQSSVEQVKQNVPKDNVLKVGQRYVDDVELNNIFTIFKNTQKANKNKYHNQLTINDIRKFRAENFEGRKSNKGRILKKASNLIKGLLQKDSKGNINTNTNTNTNANTIYNNKISLTESNVGNNNIKLKNNSKISSNSYKDSNKTLNDATNNDSQNKNLLKTYQNNLNILKEANMTNSIESISIKSNSNIRKITDSNDKKNKNIFNRSLTNKNLKMINNKNNQLFSTLNENHKIDLFKKQIQYLSFGKFSSIYKKELAKKLVSQEKIILNNIDSKNKTSKISLYMSNKLKIPKERLLMNRTEYFRINNEIKSRMTRQLEHKYSEDIFDWKKALKNSDNEAKKEETIINPDYKFTYYPNKSFYSLDNKYLEKRLSKKILKKFIFNINSINKNLGGLYIEGKNLLEFEHELAKNIKGRKILNNFEEVLPYSYLKDDLYANNFTF